jgi:diguanylate cyclase (GGDEF)-like protein/PAS domain S-box-containing protein
VSNFGSAYRVQGHLLKATKRVTRGTAATDPTQHVAVMARAPAGLDRIVRAAASVRRGGVAMVVTREAHGLRVRAHAGLPAPWSVTGELPLVLERLTLEVLDAPEPVVLPDVVGRAGSGGDAAFHAGAFFGAALRGSGAQSGALVVTAPLAGAWTEAELQRLGELAAAAADVLSAQLASPAVALLERAAEGFASFDAAWRFTLVNPAAAHMLGRIRGALLGNTLWDAVPELRDGMLHEALQRVLRDGEALTVEGRILPGGGWIEARAYPLDGGVAVHLRDATARREREDELRLREAHAGDVAGHDAFRDPLTGLANRALALDRIERMLHHAKRHEGYLFAVLFLDLDRFKNVNDALGHDVGDQLLVQVARRLETCVRIEDSVARLGGDEFVLILDGVLDVSDATRVAERVRAELGEPFGIDGRVIETSASVGIALSFTGYDNARAVLRDADAAMYRAKTGGRARVEIYDRAMHERVVARLQLETELRQAVARNELVLHYHPVVALEDGAVDCVDALVRWRHPEHGVLPPAAFIELAENSGLIVEIGWWVVREACSQLRRWREEFGPSFALRVSVNFSDRQFSQPDLMDRLEAILAETGTDPGHLRIEVREGTVMNDAAPAQRMLQRLSARGVQVCLDDFGSGFTSLLELQRLPISVLKIDPSFVRALDADSPDAGVVQTILALGRGLAIDAIAEGVETPWQLERLRALGTRFAQGYLFSKPLEAADVVRLFAVPAPT